MARSELVRIAPAKVLLTSVNLRTRNPILARRRGARNVSERSKSTHANRLGGGVCSVSSAEVRESSRLLRRPAGGREQGFKQGRRRERNYGPESTSLKKRRGKALKQRPFLKAKDIPAERRRLHHSGVSAGSQEYAVLRFLDGCPQRQARVYRRAPLGVGPPGHAH